MPARLRRKPRAMPSSGARKRPKSRDGGAVRIRVITSAEDPLIDEIARLHQTYPAEFLGPYLPAAESIARTAAHIRANLGPADCHLSCGVAPDGGIAALHWIEM